jgi:hypothetical protein
LRLLLPQEYERTVSFPCGQSGSTNYRSESKPVAAFPPPPSTIITTKRSTSSCVHHYAGPCSDSTTRAVSLFSTAGRSSNNNKPKVRYYWHHNSTSRSESECVSSTAVSFPVGCSGSSYHYERPTPPCVHHYTGPCRDLTKQTTGIPGVGANSPCKSTPMRETTAPNPFWLAGVGSSISTQQAIISDDVHLQPQQHKKQQSATSIPRPKL